MLKKMTDRIYYMPHDDRTDRPSLGLIYGDKYSMIIDSGNSPNHAKEFMAEINSMDIPPLKYLVITHHHWDHIFGIKEMNLITLANHRTKEKIDEMKTLKWDDVSLKEYLKSGRFNDFTIECIKKEIPNRETFEIGNLDIVFQDKITIDLGNLKCIIELIGGSHTDDSATVYIPKEKVIFLGDCIYGKRYNGVYGYKKENLFPMIEHIESIDAKYFIVSHMEIYNKTQINELWNELRLAEKIVGTMGSTEDSIEALSDEELTEDMKFYISCFANVNKALLNE